MSDINIKFRIQSKDRTSLDSESFVVTWQLCESLSEVYDKVEEAFARQDFRPGRTFYTSRNSGFKQLRSRATKYRKKGVELKKLRGEHAATSPQTRVDYKALAALARRLNEVSRHKSTAAAGSSTHLTR